MLEENKTEDDGSEVQMTTEKKDNMLTSPIGPIKLNASSRVSFRNEKLAKRSKILAASE